ncbi:unnamed protein product [Penicillium discolor]
MSEIELIGFEGRPVRNTGLFINNEFQLATEGSQLEVENSTTGSALASVSAAQREDVDTAVSAAKSALQGPWATVTPARRGQLLNRLADLIEQDADDLASLEALDAGVLFGESKGFHIPQATETLRHFAGWADKIAGQLLSIPQGDAYTRREPLGVCAAVVPWNAPLMIVIWKLAPAIAGGNALIIKTPELAPLYAQKLASLIKEAGFPPGVLPILCSYGSVSGQALAEHGGIKKIAFTGGAPVGREILRAAAGVSDWNKDEFANDTWSIPPPNATTKYLSVLQRPHGNVFFASADWSDGWCGWIDGAVQSGMQTARQVILEQRKVAVVKKKVLPKGLSIDLSIDLSKGIVRCTI